jgi:hypothetical protein
MDWMQSRNKSRVLKDTTITETAKSYEGSSFTVGQFPAASATDGGFWVGFRIAAAEFIAMSQV